MSAIDFIVNFDQEICVYDKKIKSYVDANINKIIGQYNIKIDNLQKQINQQDEQINQLKKEIENFKNK